MLAVVENPTGTSSDTRTKGVPMQWVARRSLRSRSIVPGICVREYTTGRITVRTCKYEYSNTMCFFQGMIFDGVGPSSVNTEIELNQIKSNPIK